MNRIVPLIRYALNGIRCGGQRILIAVLSVAFGVMSLIAMAGLAQDIFNVLLLDPRYEIGGDVKLWRGNHYLTPDDLSEIEAWQKTGCVDQYTVAAYNSALILKTPCSGRVTFLRAGIGFEPGTYPLLGEITLSTPADVSPGDVLQSPGDVIITRDIAADLDLYVGDTVLIGNQLGGAPQPVRVVGIASSTPNFMGSTLYYDLDTAAMFSSHPYPVTDAYVIWDDEVQAEVALAALSEAGWQFQAPSTLSQIVLDMRDTFNLMLKGAGILGLIVGGIGIANTMQVLLMRRREEVGILKALGYARRDILLIFVIETAIIGLAGSLLGAAAGVGLSVMLVGIVSEIVTLFINWHFDLLLTLGGVIVGVATTVLFAMNAILRVSEVRPADVFRQLPVPRTSHFRSVGTFALMAVPFATISSLILGSVWQGVAILLASLAGLVVIGGLLAGVKWLVLRLMPTFRFHLLRMARNNMRRRGLSLVFAMIALFIGTFTLGLATVIISGSQDQMEAHMLSTEGYNLVVLADPAQAASAHATLSDISDSTGVRYEAPIRAVTVESGEAVEISILKLQGRDVLWDVSVNGALWGTVEKGAYLPAGSSLPEGTPILITLMDGQQVALTVAGTYEAAGTWDRYLLPAPEGILVPTDVLFELTDDTAYALAAAEVPFRRLEAVAQQVGTALPEAAVITATDLNDTFNATLKNLFVFAAAMAGLALVAGAVLIANAVSIAMIERRYEIGVMKAMGYTRSQVLRTVLLEYGLVATIASVMGLAGMLVFLFVLAMIQEATADILVTSPALGILIVGISIGLTLLAALAAAWGPTSTHPLVILNEQG